MTPKPDVMLHTSMGSLSQSMLHSKSTRGNKSHVSLKLSEDQPAVSISKPATSTNHSKKRNYFRTPKVEKKELTKEPSEHRAASRSFERSKPSPTRKLINFKNKETCRQIFKKKKASCQLPTNPTPESKPPMHKSFKELQLDFLNQIFPGGSQELMQIPK